MKKYWIKDLTGNQVIHAPTKEIAIKLCSKFDELGLKWNTGYRYSLHLHWNLYEEKTGYLPYTGQYCDVIYRANQGYEILTIDQLLDFQKGEYPKVMEVSYDGFKWHKRVVFMEKNGKFLAWQLAETIEEAERMDYTCTWPFAREIQPALELTLDEIAEKFNVSPEQIKIKK